MSDLNPELNGTIIAALEAGVKALRGADFDTFDRLAFLVNTVNPFTENIVKAQALLQIEFTTGRLNPINPKAGKLFSADWCNADLYARLPKAGQEDKRIELGRL